MVSRIWHGIRKKSEKVPWSRLLWFPFRIPKHSVISWLAIQDRLPTKVRLIQGGRDIDGRCKLCFEEQETRDHQHELMWAMRRLKGKALITILLKLGWNDCIYGIWKERNNEHFSTVQMTEAEVLILEEKKV
ncbi:hypothetical protein J1N35_031566 [Gossypium stocksii]|uniref:Reverse transcriptase zinc-binding domain-containing protein n=1 Tax=Gossypium stocksii TaxID=47602 RepID=A0A9D3ZVW0_9ROSI|nr:hypothetical protein J1N35_031566 [Gossypium stocksii]